MTSPSELELVGRVVVGFVLAYVFGFERELRGSPAGDRTFSLVGASAAAITAVAGTTAPQAVAGIVTGVGFIGAGVLFRGERQMIKGVTTAATIFAVASIGVVVGYGHVLLGVFTAAVLLLTLEIRHVPGLSRLDARMYRGRFRSDDEPLG